MYTQRKYNPAILHASVGKSMVLDTAADFYRQLEQACEPNHTLEQRYDLLRQVFARVVEQSVLDCRIALVGLFSKVDYCIKEYQVPESVARLVHDTRKELFPSVRRRVGEKADLLSQGFPHNLKATAYLVFHLCHHEPIPASLQAHFPTADRKSSWGKFDEKVLRVVVDRWDEEYIWATEEVNGSILQISYGAANKHLTREGKGNWSYLGQILWQGAVLNLVRIRMNERGDICLPELIILEPDYLINITTVSSCFETYAESPKVHLLNKIKPAPNTMPIHLGNLSGQLLDDTVHGKRMDFEDCFKEFVSKNALNLLACPEFISRCAEFKREGINQQRNIDKLINCDLPASIGEYDRKSVMLEPSFFSPTLGLQGRFDFLEEENDRVIIIEQKSGKGEFVPYSLQQDTEKPVPREQHTVQALLYRAIYQYEMSDLQALNITPMLLYSKYARGLLELPPMPSLFLRAIRMRNLLVWSELQYATEGMEVLARLTPEVLNKKNSSGTLWNQYTRPQLQELLSPIHRASALERAYYLRFLRFIAHELLLSKVGTKLKENSGFAATWHDTLEEKKAAGSIYDQLVIDAYGWENQTVVSLTLRLLEPQSADNSNFRIGDRVILYPYRQGCMPDACAQRVIRASMVDIQENRLELLLSHPQTDTKLFDSPSTEMRWAVEHDLIESGAESLYAGMHAFLSAPQRRRDLILAQRLPEIDPRRQLKGDYGTFNELSLRAKQAKDIFLIIGPPGTGKTSYGLVNLLQEELLEEGSNVLLLSFTNRAVDEICSKLVEMRESDPSFDFIRIGPTLSCAPDYREYLLSKRCEGKSGNEVNRMIRNCRVFCGTTATLNTNLSLFALKHFQLAIVDESSQILEPHLIGLFSVCQNGVEAIDKFVLIGDHKQLPAVVQQHPEESVVTDPALQAIHLRDCRLSLFERLLSLFKTPDGYDQRFVYMLTRQGRMHRDIAEFPNLAFYGNKLDIVPLEHQVLPNQPQASDNGIRQMLTSHRVVFITSQTPPQSSSPKTNSVEADMIAATILQIYALTQDSFRADKTVGVIVPYRNQITTVRNAIDRLGIVALHTITIDTVERYQGSQRDYILYGFTIQQAYQLNFLTNNVFEEDGMIIDRKLNVAMTRARLNLILIGNPVLLRRNVTFSRLMDYVRRKGGYLALPAADYCQGAFTMPAPAPMNDQ